MVMPGPETVTVLDAAVVAMTPGMVADTVVVPGVRGSKATPPAAPPLGENDCPTAIGTVTDCPVAAVVTNCPTVAALLVTVAIKATPPTRTACTSTTKVLPAAGIPTNTLKGLFGDNEVVLVEGPLRLNAGGTTMAVPVALVNPGAETVIVTVPVAPSTPWRTKFTRVPPLGTNTSIKAVPAVTVFGETRAIAALLLAMRTVTPP